jgi:hypothetical protein
MAYITLANSFKIIRKVDLTNLVGLKGNVYNIPIFFLSKFEENGLLAIQMLFENPEQFLKVCYEKLKNIDDYKYVFESQPPAYHSRPDCDRLLSNYFNFEIPAEIKERAIAQGGEEKLKIIVHEFRHWFAENMTFLETDLKKFLQNLEIRWNVQINPKAVEFENSGPTKAMNFTIEELESNINDLIKSAGRFYYQSEQNKSILRPFSKYTFLAYKNESIYNNSTGYGDDQVKALLKEYDEKFKRPLKRLLIEYYKVKLNPSLEFDGRFLDNIGFRSCSRCNYIQLSDLIDFSFTTIDEIDYSPSVAGSEEIDYSISINYDEEKVYDLHFKLLITAAKRNLGILES